MASCGPELLTSAEMAAADRLAAAAGMPMLTLMENAGRAVAAEAARMVSPGARIAVVCGAGNNGGDGFVAARILRGWGFDVAVACLVPVAGLRGDAAEMARRWQGTIAEDWTTVFRATAALGIDALLGAGLSRPPEGAFAAAIDSINAMRGRGALTLAVDVPSGVDGTTGAALGRHVVEADGTVTFFRRKPGHLLLPGRALAGRVVVADIGIPAAVIAADGSGAGLPGGLKPVVWRAVANGPALWRSHLPRPGLLSHKYTRGHALVVSGPESSTGAARLGARGALRAGAGLVTVASPRAALSANAAHLTAIMLTPFDVPHGLAGILADTRKNAVLIGPGCGVGAETRDMVRIALASEAAVVLDADALTSFCDDEAGRRELVELTRRDRQTPGTGRAPRVVLTPHEGEFRRLFPDLSGSKLDRGRAAAERSGAVVILKGPDTVIAEPGGLAAINDNAPAWLATAGSGDVLAGFTTGLMAQGVPAFHAAAAAVWQHGACANLFGPGLIAEDIPEMLPKVLALLHATPAQAGER